MLWLLPGWETLTLSPMDTGFPEHLRQEGDGAVPATWDEKESGMLKQGNGKATRQLDLTRREQTSFLDRHLCCKNTMSLHLIPTAVSVGLSLAGNTHNNFKKPFMLPHASLPTMTPQSMDPCGATGWKRHRGSGQGSRPCGARGRAHEPPAGRKLHGDKGRRGPPGSPGAPG